MGIEIILWLRQAGIVSTQWPRAIMSRRSHRAAPRTSRPAARYMGKASVTTARHSDKSRIREIVCGVAGSLG